MRRYQPDARTYWWDALARLPYRADGRPRIERLVRAIRAWLVLLLIERLCQLVSHLPDAQALPALGALRRLRSIVTYQASASDYMARVTGHPSVVVSTDVPRDQSYVVSATADGHLRALRIVHGQAQQ